MFMDIDIKQAIAELKSVRMDLPKAQRLPDMKLVAAYQSELGIEFSDEYRIFAMEASDSIFNGKDALQMTANRDSPRELLMAVQEARQQGVPTSWLPICEDNSDYYCLLEDGSIRYWSHHGETKESWENLAAWIKDVWIGGK